MNIHRSTKEKCEIKLRILVRQNDPSCNCSEGIYTIRTEKKQIENMKHKICQKFLKISVFKTYYHAPLSQQQYTRRNLDNDNQAGARTKMNRDFEICPIDGKLKSNEMKSLVTSMYAYSEKKAKIANMQFVYLCLFHVDLQSFLLLYSQPRCLHPIPEDKWTQKMQANL